MSGGTLSILGQIKAKSGPNRGSQRAGLGGNQRCCNGQEVCMFLHGNDLHTDAKDNSTLHVHVVAHKCYNKSNTNKTWFPFALHCQSLLNVTVSPSLRTEN